MGAGAPNAPEPSHAPDPLDAPLPPRGPALPRVPESSYGPSRRTRRSRRTGRIPSHGAGSSDCAGGVVRAGPPYVLYAPDLSSQRDPAARRRLSPPVPEVVAPRLTAVRAGPSVRAPALTRLPAHTPGRTSPVSPPPSPPATLSARGLPVSVRTAPSGATTVDTTPAVLWPARGTGSTAGGKGGRRHARRDGGGRVRAVSAPAAPPRLRGGGRPLRAAAPPTRVGRGHSEGPGACAPGPSLCRRRNRYGSCAEARASRRLSRKVFTRRAVANSGIVAASTICSAQPVCSSS